MMYNINSPSSQKTSAVSLELDHQIRDPQIPFLFKMRQDSGPEEDLGLTDPVQIPVQLQSSNHVLTSFLSIHESLGNDIGSQEFISLTELLERDPVGESLPANPDSFQDTIASELIEDEGGVDLAGPLLVVGDDAPDEVGVGVLEGDHKPSQLFLVEL